MADIDRAAFAEAIMRVLDRAGLSFGKAVETWPELDKAMLSRACSEKPLSAANFLLVCKVMGLDPFAYLIHDKQRRVRLRDIAKRLSEQSVTPVVKRETYTGAGRARA
ncbi:hypothetical protein [Nitratireductor luteus]|uniref:hypothetical protein n=1 Tax=Nitratireductor luteus TaxID=2976980 RepID=UPI00223EBCE2|nr:hypothetical protein [Nitratireductor luteus]